MDKKQKGKSGEDIALSFLKKNRYKILDRNYTTKMGEIDIIAKSRESVIVFIEVKYRTSDLFGNPREAVTHAKQLKYSRVATEYLLRHKLTDTNARFDVIDILGDEITHIQNAFDNLVY